MFDSTFPLIAKPLFAAALIALPAALTGFPALAETWQAMPVKVPGGPVSDIRVIGSGGDARSFVFANGRWMELTACAEHRFCFTPRRPEALRRAPESGLPDGFVAARAAAVGPVSAWYEQPTTAYGHGILGDKIEAAALAVQTAAGERLHVAAGRGQVFEDLTPRLADLNGDGRNEVIAIRSDIKSGAAVVIYGVADGALKQIAATPTIGSANRWRNPSLIVRNPESGETLIGEVVTPHIGGTLKLWALRGSARSGFRLEERGSAGGFSNHAIGSRQLNLSAAAVDGLFAVPSADRRMLRIMQATADGLSARGETELPGRIEQAIGVVTEPSGTVFLAALGDGSLHAVSRPNAAFYCIRNQNEERLLLVAETRSGQRRKTLAAPGRNWCVPRSGLATVWAFVDEDAIEGCSHLVASNETGLDLKTYASFDNCRWAVR